MHLFVHIFGITIPGYGLMIVLGVISANLIAHFILKKNQLDGNDFLILEAYMFLGAFIGAKLLYIFVSFRQIEWNRMMELKYFNFFMQTGFVFYGGLIGGILFFLLAGKIHHIKAGAYLEQLVFLIPWVHGFGRIGCYMAGCCYGMPYKGVFAVHFPPGCAAPSNVSLFPVQLLEAGSLFLLSIVIVVFQIKKIMVNQLAVYLLGYSIIRFILEFFRYDHERGDFLMFSTSQWISIFLFAGTGIAVLKRRRSAL